jgi:hypothetical protein
LQLYTDTSIRLDGMELILCSLRDIHVMNGRSVCVLSVYFVCRTTGWLVMKFGADFSELVLLNFPHSFRNSNITNARTSEVEATLVPFSVGFWNYVW